MNDAFGFSETDVTVLMAQATGTVGCGYLSANREWKLLWFSEDFTTDPVIIYQKMNLILKFKTKEAFGW